MDTPRRRLEADVQAALKGGHRERVSNLRLLLAELNNEALRRGGGEVDEAGFAALVRKAVKQHEEAAAQFRAGGREELAAKEEREAAELAAYLPQQASAEELRAAAVEVVARLGASGPAAIGPVMKEMLARFGARADGGAVNRVVRELLAGK
jgi:uncharacterized protein YqeY